MWADEGLNRTFGIDESFSWRRIGRRKLLLHFGDVLRMQVVEQALTNQVVLQKPHSDDSGVNASGNKSSLLRNSDSESYLTVVQNFIHRLWDEQNFSTVASDNEEKTIGSLRRRKRTTQEKKKEQSFDACLGIFRKTHSQYQMLEFVVG